MLEAVLAFFQGFMNLGAAVLLPVVICILGLFFKMKFGQAVKSGLLAGIGFQGLCLAVGLLTTTIQPVMDYYEARGSGYDVLEIGFAALGAASWTVPFAVFAIPAMIIINIVLVRLKITKVLNVDIWNFMHFLVPGALAYALFGNAVVGFCVTVGLSVITLFFAQWAAPQWGEFFGLEGTTCTTLSFVSWAYPIGVGAFLGILTKQDISSILTICMGVAAVMLLIPKMVGIMMEGLTPIGTYANTYMKEKIGEDADLYIGMDIALGLGDPCCITCTAIMIPLTIVMALLIPDMRFFPLGILAEVCYLSPMCVLPSKGNVFRSLVVMTVIMLMTLIFANMFATEATQMLSVTGISIDGMVTASHFGWNPGNLIISFLHKLF